MAHILSYELRQEFLSAPGLARLTLAYGATPQEPTLLLKCPTLTIKYCISLAQMEIILLMLDDGRLAYGVRVYDDPNHPSTHWSILEAEVEKLALEGLLDGGAFPLFLFNELTVNVAWVSFRVDAGENALDLSGVVMGKVTHDDYAKEFSDKMRCLEKGELTAADGRAFEIIPQSEWRSVESNYVTNRFSNSMVSVFSTDEGGQQEEVALWLIDGLCLKGAIRGPQVDEEGGSRELSDLLISYDNGTFLIESKALSIFSRDSLPDRKKLTRATKKHIRKAVRQLVGGVKNLRRGLQVTDSHKKQVNINITAPPHLIVLVPDLTLLSGESEFGCEFVLNVMREAEGYFHILDPMALFRHVQAAHMLCEASKSQRITSLMAFDYWLLKRFEVAKDKDHPNFEVLVQIE